jgi:hypothetical protein
MIDENTFPRLKKIQGSLNLHNPILSGKAFSALTQVTGSVCINETRVDQAAFCKLQKIGSQLNCYLTRFDSRCFSKLKTIDGSICAEASRFESGAFSALESANSLCVSNSNIDGAFQRLLKLTGGLRFDSCSLSNSRGFRRLRSVMTSIALIKTNMVNGMFSLLEKVMDSVICHHSILRARTFANLAVVKNMVRLNQSSIGLESLSRLTCCQSLEINATDFNHLCFTSLEAVRTLRIVRSCTYYGAFPKLKFVMDDAQVRLSSFTCLCPRLTGVGGSLSIDDSKSFARDLVLVAGNVSLRGRCLKEEDFPKLQTIGGNIEVSDKQCILEKNVFPALKNINKEEKSPIHRKIRSRPQPITREKAKQLFDEACLKAGWLDADGILCRIKRKKTVGSATVYRVVLCGEDQLSYCVSENGLFSHGATYKEAKEGLLYKFQNDRDTSAYRDWTPETKVSLRDAIESYHVITGACSAGILQFCQGKKLKKKYTIREILEATKEAYGHNVYQAFFEKNKK